jgi:hypothetical protein
MADDDDLPQRLERIATRLSEEAKTGGSLTVEQQQIASRLVNTLPYLSRLKGAQINVAQAEIALEALLAAPPAPHLAEGVVSELERRVDIFKSVWKSVRAGRTVASYLLLGVTAHAVAASVVFVACALASPTWRIWNAPGSIAPWVFVGGSLGGVVSLLVRLHDFAILERWAPETDPRLLFYTGFLKPTVGIVFAFFVWTALKAEIFSLPAINQSAEPQLVAFALAFIAGFSERLAPDIANRTLPPMKRDGA